MSLSIMKSVLKQNGVGMLIDYDEKETEQYFQPLGTHVGDGASQDSNDTRYMLNQQHLNIWRFMKKIGAKMEYIKSGTTGHVFKGELMRDGNVEYTFAVKVSAYLKRKANKYGDVTNISRPENAELMMLRILSYFIATGQTPHLIIPIQTFTSNIEPFTILNELPNWEKIKASRDTDIYNRFLKTYKEGKYESTVSVLLLEWANKGDFATFVKERYKNFELKHWKVFFFQILSVLAVIQSKYPAFRHNDMKANNILVHKQPTCKSKAFYIVNGKRYLVPNIGYQIKLCDFDFACIRGIVNNIKVTEDWTQRLNITTEKNRYYDIHYFFNSITKNGFVPEIKTDLVHIPNEVREFIDRVIPKKYHSYNYVDSEGKTKWNHRLMSNDEYTTPQILLERDPFFADFRKISL